MPVPAATANTLIAQARNLPDLIASAQRYAPDLAKSLTAKPLLYAKSPPTVLLATGLAWASTRYGLGWDDATCALLSGAVLTGVAYAMRAITRQPIAGVVTTPAEVAAVQGAAADKP